MISTSKPAIQWKSAVAGFAIASVLFFARDLVAADAAPSPVAVKQAFQEKLPNVPGKTLTGIHVTYLPGGKSASHAHAGSVHTVSENASDTEPAALLAIFVADDGAQLSKPAPPK